MRRWMRRRKKGKSGERKGAWLPSYVKTGETHLSSFQVNRMRTPITLVHLGRRSTYFRQIGRNGVVFDWSSWNPHHRRRNPPRRVLFFFGPRSAHTYSSILWPCRLFYLFVCTSGICSTSGPDISSILIATKKCNNFLLFISNLNLNIHRLWEEIFLINNKIDVRKKRYSKKQIQILRRKSPIMVIKLRSNFVSRRQTVSPSPLQTHFTIRQLIKRRRGVFEEYSMRRGNSSDKSSPSLPPFVLRPSWAICVLYRRCFPPGEKAGGTLYSWRRNGSLRRMKQRRIIYAPCGRVHKAQIF